MIKLILLLKKLFNSQFYSCQYISNGINFYPNNIIKACCYTDSADVDLYKIIDNKRNNYKILQRNRKKLFNRLKKGNIPECCKNCPNLKKNSWNFSKLITSITLNYYMFCNLKCSHCGYYKNVRFKLNDTKDKSVLNLIKYLEKKSITSSNYFVDVGGGEPSLNNNLDEIINYLVQKGHVVHINSNVAKFKENYVEGIKKDLIKLTLTPDAGSRDIYKKIKGADYFDIVKENIKKYMAVASDKIEVKFILENGNVCDIENMIKLCTDCGVKNVICSIDLNVPKEEYDFYKPYFIKFRDLCHENNLMLSYTSFVPEEFIV